MFILFGRKSPLPEAPPPERRPPIEIIFLDEEYIDDANTFMRLPFVPRQGEEIQLEGDFRRGGCFVVERVATAVVCNGRHNGWVRDDLLEVYVYLYVREKQDAPHGHGEPSTGARMTSPGVPL